jgi:tRNA acetyltransferase TAN1
MTCDTKVEIPTATTFWGKIRHKITYNDTFNLTCHGDYLYEENKLKIESELIEQIKNITKIEENETCPNWDINLYIIGEITGINIKRKYYNQI